MFFSFAIFSCAKKSDTSSTTTTTTEIEGTFLTNCFQSGSYYNIQTITVTGTDVVVKYEWHTDSSCSTDYALWEDTYDSLSIGDEVTFSDATKGHKFTLEVVSFKLTPQSASTVSSVNTANYCGYSDWELNVAKDITGKTCVGTTIISANTKLLSLYKNESSNTIQLGSFNIESDGYPDSVSSLDFTKQ